MHPQAPPFTARTHHLLLVSSHEVTISQGQCMNLLSHCSTPFVSIKCDKADQLPSKQSQSVYTSKASTPSSCLFPS